jgi:hypothetical protein
MTAEHRTHPVLDVGHSAALRDTLLAEVASLASADSAVTWAARALPAKNSLIGTDAKRLEDAFEQKLSARRRDDHSGRLDITGPITEGRVLINAQVAAPLLLGQPRRLSKK